MPPSPNARAFAPFLTKTPAQMPQTVPKESSYRFRDDSACGGRGGSPGSFGAPLGGGGGVGVVGRDPAARTSQHTPFGHMSLSELLTFTVDRGPVGKSRQP